jgi:vitamin B12 transporter
VRGEPILPQILPWRGGTLAVAALLVAAPAGAVTVRGVVTDTLKRPVAHAIVALVDNGKVIVSAETGFDGAYQLSTGTAGRFYVLASGQTFLQVQTESFYAPALASVVRNVILEPDTVRQSVVVTATGRPTPSAQVSASITTLHTPDFANFENLTEALRTVPGFSLAQQGERGALTSLFVRGGNSDGNAILLDGAPITDIGGVFDFSNVSTTGIASAEAYRGPNSVVYGADAGAGVVNLETPRGSTPFPSLFYEGDGGNFGTYRNQVQAGGTLNAVDYYGAFADFQSPNSVPSEPFHDITSVANLGYALSANTQLRLTVRNSDSATGAPGEYQFQRIANDAKQADQNLFLTGVADHTFTPTWHGSLLYGLSRKREQYFQYAPVGIYDPDTEVYVGQNVSVTGANGYTVQGQAIVNYNDGDFYRSDQANNRDTLHALSEWAITPHLAAVAGFRYENERGAYRLPFFGTDENVTRRNDDYTLLFQGDYHDRLFYTLGGAVENNGLYGTVGAPHLGASYYLVKPGAGLAQGTRLNFNFSKGYKEPTLGQQTNSLYALLETYGGTDLVNSYPVGRLGAATTRSYDGGVEQSFWHERVIVRATYFHNEFGNQVESVPYNAVPQLLPDLSPAQQQSLEALLKASGAAPSLNSLSFRAQGAESEVEYGVRRDLFVRGGYTYLDTAVQRSFASSALVPTFNTDSNFAAIPIGAFSPLVGARAFRRPPHTGFVTAVYSHGKWASTLTGTFAGASDDSTFLAGSDANFGNSLLLPNRNLDYGFANVSLGGSYNVRTWAAVYTQLNNLLSQQHISPIGYLSDPFTVRSGVRLSWGKGVKQ